MRARLVVLEGLLILARRRTEEVGLIVACEEKTSRVLGEIGKSFWRSSQILLTGEWSSDFALSDQVLQGR
jgi:hypothetical protein